MALDLLKTPYELLLEQAGYPRMQAGGQPPRNASLMAMASRYGGLGGAGQSVDMTSSNPINVYRADPTGRYGGKDRMETRPTVLDKTTLQDYIKAMREGEALGVPQLTQDQLARMALVEGRSDFGFNALNEDNKLAMKKAQLLQEMGHNRVPADFAAALYDKQKVAERINKPFQEVWNGTGRSGMTGRTGAQHNDRYNEFGYAVDHPKNADLMQAINEAYNYQPPVKQTLGANEYADPMGSYIPTIEQNKPGRLYANGGAVKPKTFHDISKLLIQKHLGK
jgi:hypothetical protein